MLLDVVDERRGSPRDLGRDYRAARARLMGTQRKQWVPVPALKARPVTWLFDRIRIPPPVTMLLGISIKITAPPPMTIHRIVRAVADYYRINPTELISARREQRLVDARHVAMHLARILTSKSFPEIGRRMGNRDHTTILYGIRKMEKLLADPASPIHYDIAQIRAMLEA
jgi:hypothetical protein